MVGAAGVDAVDRLAFALADLTSDDGWDAAVAGVDYVLHTASPFPSENPSHEDELIIPARDGTLRVLRAAEAARVRRVVVTSSFAAVGYTAKADGSPYTEQDWTDPSGQPPYIASKTIAERSAWDYAADHDVELVTINPTAIFGPALGSDYSSSLGLIKQLLEGALPGIPDLAFGVVDVRDVVDAHLRALDTPEASGQRFIAVGQAPVTLFEIAQIMRTGLGPAGSRVPRHRLPSWLVRALALARPGLREIVPQLGNRKQISNAKARTVLGWQPRPLRDTILDTSHSLSDIAS
jgi:dihydroflavonol-4-reductase